MEDKFYGEVCWFNSKKGYGFIVWEKDGVKQKDLFCHYSDVSMEGYKTLYKGQKVSFNIGENRNGDPKAVDILVLRH